MPKELTHWHVAKKALSSNLPPRIHQIIQQNLELYYLGAVAHDIPFYDLSQPPEVSLERIGNEMHGVSGENTLVPLIDILERALRRGDRVHLLCFVLGMLTHYVVDSTFHPFVYYLSGNYFDQNTQKRAKAVFRHRLLETGIDLWLETSEPMDYPTNLASLWRRAGTEGKEAFSLLVRHFTMEGDKGTPAHFKSAWRNHRILQSLFRKTIPWRILTLYRRIGHPGAEKLEALFYPQPLNLSIFASSFTWRHPVTGEKYNDTLEEIYKTSIEKVITLFLKLGDKSEWEWPEILSQMKPLSLDSGLVYCPAKEMKYFMAEPIENKLRTI